MNLSRRKEPTSAVTLSTSVREIEIGCAADHLNSYWTLEQAYMKFHINFLPLDLVLTQHFKIPLFNNIIITEKQDLDMGAKLSVCCSL
jgi:hypothetical protein